MRIAQVSESFLPIVDGVGRVVYSYAQTLGEMGHASYAIVPEVPMGDLPTSAFTTLAYRSLKAPGKLPYYWGVPEFDEYYRKMLKQTPLDIVHAHSPFIAGNTALAIAKKRKIPLVGTFHSKFYDDFYAATHSKLLAKQGVTMVARFFEHCDEVWAVSAQSGETLRSYGYKGPIVVMPNGTNVREADPAAVSLWKMRLKLTDEVVLLFVGQIHEKKNIRRVLEATRVLTKNGVRVRLILAGQGPHQEDFEEAAKELEIANVVNFVGHVGEPSMLDGLYALADLFVFPSIYDNAPMVVREAAALGTPSILIAGSNAAECVRHGIDGLTCKDDADDLAATIRRAVSDKPYLHQLGEVALATIPMPWPRILTEAAGRYQALINRKRR